MTSGWAISLFKLIEKNNNEARGESRYYVELCYAVCKGCLLEVAWTVEAVCAYFALWQADSLNEGLDGVEFQRGEV